MGWPRNAIRGGNRQLIPRSSPRVIMLVIEAFDRPLHEAAPFRLRVEVVDVKVAIAECFEQVIDRSLNGTVGLRCHGVALRDVVDDRVIGALQLNRPGKVRQVVFNFPEKSVRLFVDLFDLGAAGPLKTRRLPGCVRSARPRRSITLPRPSERDRISDSS